MRNQNMTGTDKREREPYSKSDAVRPKGAAAPSNATRMDPPYTESPDSRRSEYRRNEGSFLHSKPSTPSSPFFNSERNNRPLPPHSDTTRRGPRGGGGDRRRSVDASPRDVMMSDAGGAYPPRRGGGADDRDDRFRNHSRRGSGDGPFGAGSSTGGLMPAGAHPSNGPQQSITPCTAADISTSASAILSEASYKYGKLMEATMKFNTAKIEKTKHEPHFVSFPLMRERYEAALIRAEKELRKAQEDWGGKSILVDSYLGSILQVQQQQPARELEDITRRVSMDVIYKDIGTSSIQKYIEKTIHEKVASFVLSSGITEMRVEIHTLLERDKRRGAEFTELSDYCKSSIEKLETGWKSVESKQVFLNATVEQIRTSVQELKKDVLDAQQLAVMASDAMQNLEDLKAKVDQYEEDVKMATTSLSNVNTEAYNSQQLLLQQQLVSGQMGMGRSPAAGDYVTWEEFNAAKDDNTDIIKNYVETTMISIAEECEECSKAIKSGEEKIATLTIEFDTVKAQGLNTTEAFNTFQKDFQNAVVMLESSVSGEIKTIKKMIGQQEGVMEGLTMGVKHCDERLTEWSTKDFYEKVANLLCQRTPNWFAIGSQVQTLTTNYQALATNHQRLAAHVKSLLMHTATAQSREPRQNGTMPQVIPTNTNTIASANDHPTPSDVGNISRINKLEENLTRLNKLEETVPRINKIEEAVAVCVTEIESTRKSLEDHLIQHKLRMDDIFEWSRGVVAELANRHDMANKISEEIGTLRMHFRRQHSDSPGSLASPGLGNHATSTDREELKPLSEGVGQE